MGAAAARIAWDGSSRRMLCTIVERIMPVGFYGSDMRAMNIEVRSPGVAVAVGRRGRRRRENTLGCSLHIPGRRPSPRARKDGLKLTKCLGELARESLTRACCTL